MKRATINSDYNAVNKKISIHALVKRATFVRIVLAIVSIYFNPRPREEGDEKIEKLEKLIEISIHALVKRVTVRCCKSVCL